MASLGWLLNLDFAGSESGAAAAAPLAGSLVLLGVGRAWWVPMVWQATTGTAYAGEWEPMMDYVSDGVLVAAGALALYGVQRIRAYLRRKRLEAQPEVKFVKDDRHPSLVGWLGGPGRVCHACGKHKDPVGIYSNGKIYCSRCAEATFGPAQQGGKERVGG